MGSLDEYRRPKVKQLFDENSQFTTSWRINLLENGKYNITKVLGLIIKMVSILEK